LRAKRGNLPVNLVVNKEAGGFKQGDRFVPREDEGLVFASESAAICLFDHHEKDSRADRHVAALLAVTRASSLRAKRGNLPF